MLKNMAFPFSLIISIVLQTFLASVYETDAGDTAYLDSRCSNNTFAPNSTYQINLHTLFLNLTSSAGKSLAGIDEQGSASDRDKDIFYGLFLCRGDLSLASCEVCVAGATYDLLESYCPLRKAAVIWYNECMVRYSNEAFFGKIKVFPKVVVSNNQNITGNTTHFSEILMNSVSNLADMTLKTDHPSSLSNFYTESTKLLSSKELRSSVQCTPDLTAINCTRCLMIGISQLPICTAARILQPSCNIWYEVYDSSYSSIDAISTDHTGKMKLSTIVIVSTVVPVGSIILALFTLYLITSRANMKRKSAMKNAGDAFFKLESIRYDLTTLQQATRNFSEDNKVFEDRYGTSVYKGIVPNRVEVAVKRMSKNYINVEQDFKNEVLSLAKLQHKNLVRLNGFCIEGQEKLLVFDWVPHHLSDFLLDSEHRKELGWESRFQIISGIARAILYLHQDSRHRIIHGDLTVYKILVDDHMNPKLANFSTAALFHGDQTDVLEGNTSPNQLTFPHMSPDYEQYDHDIFSFGVLVLEIIAGRIHSTSDTSLDGDLLSYAWKQWKDDKLLEFVDEGIRETCSIEQLKRCVHLGLLCVQESMYDRPTMATIVLMLESDNATLQFPEQPAYSMVNYAGTKAEDDVEGSWNDVSITLMDPR